MYETQTQAYNFEGGTMEMGEPEYQNPPVAAYISEGRLEEILLEAA